MSKMLNLIVVWIVFLCLREGIASDLFRVRSQNRGICLTLMVKNEFPGIKQCLESTKEVIDCIAVCDVGSTDETLKWLEHFAQEQKIPLYISRVSWRDFPYNRTIAVQTAQKMLETLGFSLPDSYLLMLDADMVLKVSPSFCREDLAADAYLLMENSAILCFYRYTPHLLRASLPWKSSGFVGESWSIKRPYKTERLNTMMVVDQGAGGCSSERRDLTVLKKAYHRHPSDEHALFYLAQAHCCQKNYSEAIPLYLARIEKGGDKEELWFSRQMLGKCYEGLQQWDKAIYWYLEAYQFIPERTETLLKAAILYRQQGKNDVAHLFAKYGSLLPRPTHQLLYDISPFTDYQFEEELSIASYYTRFRDEGYEAISNLVLRRQVPWHAKEQAYRNLVFYSQNLKNAQFCPINIPLPLIYPGSDERYHPMNPSILKTPEGYQVICRTVNYTQEGAKVFNTIDMNGIFRTRNFLLRYDHDWNLISQCEIIENLPRERIRSCNVEGLEDCRLFELQGTQWITCTTSDTSPTGQRQISLCKLSEMTSDKVFVEKLIPLQGPDPNRCEKNWLPFVKDGELYLIYSYDPFIVYRPDIETGACETVLSYEPIPDLSHFRGSAPPIEMDGGYLMLIHETVYQPNYHRIYFHRFVYLDENFTVEKVSKPFTFQHIGIEFCCGMTIDHTGSQLILAVGIEDREATLCFVDLETVRSLLYPFPKFIPKIAFK